MVDLAISAVLLLLGFMSVWVLTAALMKMVRTARQLQAELAVHDAAAQVREVSIPRRKASSGASRNPQATSTRRPGRGAVAAAA